MHTAITMTLSVPRLYLLNGHTVLMIWGAMTKGKCTCKGKKIIGCVAFILFMFCLEAPLEHGLRLEKESSLAFYLKSHLALPPTWKSLLKYPMQNISFYIII